MKTSTNHGKIKRNARIGQIATIVALLVLGTGLFISFKFPDKSIYSLICLLLGFILSQVGIHLGNRWGRSPRPYEVINKSLKGMGRDYTVYHYTTPASHLIVGPAGIWIIRSFHQGGTISYDGKRWRASGGGISRSYLRLLGQESLGQPALETEAEIQALTRYFEKKIAKEMELPIINAVLLFTDPTVNLKVENPPFPTIKPDALKEILKAAAKKKPISSQELDFLQSVLPEPEKN